MMMPENESTDPDYNRGKKLARLIADPDLLSRDPATVRCDLMAAVLEIQGYPEHTARNEAAAFMTAAKPAITDQITEIANNLNQAARYHAMAIANAEHTKDLHAKLEKLESADSEERKKADEYLKQVQIEIEKVEKTLEQKFTHVLNLFWILFNARLAGHTGKYFRGPSEIATETEPEPKAEPDAS